MMRPLSELNPARLAGVRGVLTDIDDTITTEGRITAQAYSAIELLHDAGYLVIPVTGRPAGWCDHIARMWPVDAVVGENGAFYMRYDRERRKLTTRHIDHGGDAHDAREGKHESTDTGPRRDRLHAIGERILQEVPGSAWASDQAYRHADIAIDFCEDVPRLSRVDIGRIVEIMGEEGLTAKVSSIHVNGWFGAYDKLGMTRTLLAEAFGIDLDDRREDFIFVGDSPNDAPMFQFFPLSVGVQNVADFVLAPGQQPKFITSQRSGRGFAEVVQRLTGQVRECASGSG